MSWYINKRAVGLKTIVFLALSLRLWPTSKTSHPADILPREVELRTEHSNESIKDGEPPARSALASSTGKIRAPPRQLFMSAPTLSRGIVRPLKVASLGYEYPLCPWVSDALVYPRGRYGPPMAASVRSCVDRLVEWVRAGKTIATLDGKSLLAAVTAGGSGASHLDTYLVSERGLARDYADHCPELWTTGSRSGDTT